MSQVNTSSAEQRRIMLKAMVKMSYLTANPKDRLTVNAFLEIGCLTMLTALLANESGVVKEMAALCLGNLVVTPPQVASNGGLESSLGTNAVFGWKTDEEIEVRQSLRKEVANVNGVSALVNLLSSPQARVSLHGVGSHSFLQERVQRWVGESFCMQ
jgi:hypothetical protein